MSRIICFSYERLFYPDGNLSGSGMRLWKIAQFLKAKRHDVTIAELNHAADYLKDDIKIISWDNLTLKDIKERFDAAYVPLSAYSDRYFDEIEHIPTIVDLSTPLPAENRLHSIGDSEGFYLNDGLMPTMNALGKADMRVCSTEKQRLFYSGMLAALGCKIDKEMIKLAPFAPEKTPMDRIIPGNDYQTVLWLGSIFSWYDYETPIRAMAELKSKKIRLVFAGASNPNIPQLTESNYKKAERFARSKGLLNKSVFFIDWLSPEDLRRLLSTSDAAVVCTHDSLESDLAYRLRYIELLQARLPIICTENDDFSSTIQRQGLGGVIKMQDHKGLAKTIGEVLKTREEISQRMEKYVQEQFNREICLAPIDEFCRKPHSAKKLERIDFTNLISQLKARIRELEFIRSDKLATNASLAEELKKNEIRFEEILSDKKRGDQEFRENIATLNETISKQKEILQRQGRLVGEFRGSIVYPLYKLSHSIGETGFGKMLSRLLK